MSNSYLEALAAGLPLVSTLTAGTDELLIDGENGCIIRGSKPVAVGKALERVLSLSVGNSRRRAVETARRFSIRQTVEKYEALFEEAIASRRL